MIDYAKHQRDGISFQQVQPTSILAMSTGTGKTVTTLGSELANLSTKKLDKCIFCCTKASLGEVLNDYKKFYNFEPMQLSSFESVRNFFLSKATVAVTRYEWLKFFEEGFIAEQSKEHKIGMWWDEAQKLKSTSTVAHKRAAMLRPYCSAFHLVTATPIMTSLDDLWSLMHILNPNVLGDYEWFAKNFYVRKLTPHPKVARRKMKCPTCGCRLHFEDGWDLCYNPMCQSIQTPTGYVPFRREVKCTWDLIEWKNLDKLAQLIKPYMFCFFPEQDIHYISHEFDLAEDTEDYYFKIAQDTIKKEDARNKWPFDKTSEPFSVRLIELQYIVDRSFEKRAELYKLANKLKDKGFILYLTLYNTEGKNMSATTLDYVKAVLDKVEGLEYRTYTGADFDDAKEANKKWFQQDAKGKCLIISQAGGASLNLQSTNEFVFYNIPWGFGAISQGLGRVVRYFSKFKTFNIHFILGEHTVDTYKHICFRMYADVIQKLMNNKLLSSAGIVNFNTQMKKELRNYLLWRNGYSKNI